MLDDEFGLTKHALHETFGNANSQLIEYTCRASIVNSDSLRTSQKLVQPKFTFGRMFIFVVFLPNPCNMGAEVRGTERGVGTVGRGRKWAEKRKITHYAAADGSPGIAGSNANAANV